MNTYLAVYLGSTILALFITPIIIWFAGKIKAFDNPGLRTVHELPIPRIGGIAIFLSAMSLFIAVLFIDNTIGIAFRNMQLQLIVLFFSSTVIFLIGLVDDLKGLPARFKFIAEVLAGCLLCLAGLHISTISITERFVLHLGLLSYPLTIFWIVGITNAVNLSDGLDGLAAGIAAITCGVIAIFAIQGGGVVMAVLMLALLGSLTGFLFFNFNPAKIFMGDCGSLFLGFTIASASVMCATKSSALVGLALPALALGIPIFDTLFSMLRRFLERRGMFSPDRGHFHHRLIDLGLRQRHAVIIIYVITLMSAGMGMFMMIAREELSIFVFFCILILILLAFRVVGSVRLRETITKLQEKYKIADLNKQEQVNFEKAQLHFRNARTYDQWWQAVCNAAERLDFAWLSLKTQDNQGNITTEIWRMQNDQPDLSKLIVMTVPFNRGELSREFEIAISVNGSYESAGHRATLFSRLIDENCLLPQRNKANLLNS